MTIHSINGSPRGETASSQVLIQEMKRISAELMGDAADWQHYQATDSTQAEQILEADVLILAFPLYVDGPPAGMLRCMEALRAAGTPQEKPLRVFALVNCGFYEGLHNRVCLEIVENLCISLGARYCGGIGIGTGEMIRAMQAVPEQAGIRRPIFSALNAAAEALARADGALHENIYTQHALPRFLYKVLGESGWRKQVRKNGLKPTDLHAQPYKPVRGCF